MKHTINDLAKSDWFPYKSRITIREFIETGELKATQESIGGTMKRFVIKDTDAKKLASKLKQEIKNQHNID